MCERSGVNPKIFADAFKESNMKYYVYQSSYKYLTALAPCFNYVF